MSTIDAPRPDAPPDDRCDAFDRRLAPDALRRHGDRTALVAGERVVTYVELAELVDRRTVAFGAGRRLAVIEMTPTVEAVVDLLAAFACDHAAAPAGDRSVADRWADHYGADLVTGDDRGVAGSRIDHRTPPAARSSLELHPDLALLLSTSGSTGAPKLVRLSRDAIEANAASIAAYLGLTPTDRAITVLPLHYCYGLSVLTSHLVVGAGVVLTGASVVDPCFWDAADRNGVTGLAMVPHSFELVERVGRERLCAPSLRYITQAGGRLAPDRVRAFADLGAGSGWDLYVMYGQTEATARMAYLPPEEASRRPASVGIAIPGGSIRLDLDEGPDGQADVGEVVYSGPNVMMGYAEGPDDLARGHDHSELRTGDLGRLDPDGFLEIVGRASRFVKIHGKRVDLDHVERVLVDGGRPAVCVGDDDGLVIAVVDESVKRTDGGRTVVDEELHRAVASMVDVPEGRIVAARVGQLPRTSSGKLDAGRLLGEVRSVVVADRSSAVGVDASVAAIYASVLGRDDLDPGESFASLGGDSFSYVEASIRVESALGRLPDDWHLRSIGELDAMRVDVERPRRSGVQLDSSVVLRAIGILLIVCTHMRLYRLPGGAHGLLAVVGYNFARFQLGPTDVADRLRRMGATIARVVVPTSAWVGLNMLLAGGYSLGALLLVNNYTGDAARRGGRWEYWYFEAFVQIMIVLAVLFSIGAVRRLERRAPFGFALAVLAVTLAIRFDAVQWGGEYNEMFRPHTVACFVALGWCAHRCRSVWQRLLVTALAIVTCVGYFGQTDREWRIAMFVAALVWIPSIRLPRPVAPVVSTIAAASMWIFLVHWQVWPLFTPWLERHVAFVATIATGVAVWWLYERVRRAWASDGYRPTRLGQEMRRVLGRNTNSQVSAADTATRTSDAKPVAA